MAAIDTTDYLNDLVIQVRRDILRQVHNVNSGHPGGSLGCAEFFVALYQVLMQRSDSFEMDGIDEDLFFLSNGHISPVFYSVLARSGYFPLEELKSFRLIDSRLQGHPTTYDGLPGVRVASGSLGQGISVAIGAALTKKLNQDPHLVYVLCGDGELQEGQNWEAIMYAAGNKVDNLIVTVDLNGQQIDGSTDSVLPLGNLKEKFFNSAYILKAISDNKSTYKSILVIPKYEKCALNKLANLSTCSDCLEELSIPAINIFNIIEALKISLDLGYFNEAFSFINTLDKVCEGDCRDCGNYKL